MRSAHDDVDARTTLQKPLRTRSRLPLSVLPAADFAAQSREGLELYEILRLQGHFGAAL